MGALLKGYSNVSHLPYSVWAERNKNLSGLFDAVKRHAYRPAAGDRDSSLIDGRTYFYIRDFLSHAHSIIETVALIPTWIMSLSEDKVWFKRGVSMPFHIDNVDLTVCANSLYGITAALLSGLVGGASFDEEMQLIYRSTASFVSWQVAHNFSSRPDLALTYYPSVYNFFWFTSRILNLLNRFDELPYQVMDQVRTMLSTAMRQHATEYILKRAVRDGDTGYAYFDDFIGEGDKDIFGVYVVKC